MTTKKEYTAPSLTVYGDVETLTKAIGKGSVKDGIFVNGEPLNVVTDGNSVDLVINF